MACFFSLSCVFAYIPSVESLFRNGANTEIEGSTVVVNLHISKMITGEEKAVQETNQETAKLKEFKDGYYKFLYLQDFSNDSVKMVQVGYETENMRVNEITSLRSFNNFVKFPFSKGVESTEQGLFYSLLQSLALNRGDMMISYLRSRGVSVKLNKDLLNKEKAALLEKYMLYLKKVKDDPSLNESLESPLDPKNEEQRVSVKEVLKQPFFHESSIVKRVKERSSFFWKVETENFNAKFENETRKLQTLELQTTWGSLAIQCKDFLVFDGSHEFPKYIYFKDFQGNYYQIRMLSMKQFDENKSSFETRYTNYRKSLSENKKEDGLVFTPNFIL